MNMNVGDRIRLTATLVDPDPIPAGATGTITRIGETPWERQVSVSWDPPHAHRTLMLLEGTDDFEVVQTAEDARIARLYYQDAKP